MCVWQGGRVRKTLFWNDLYISKQTGIRTVNLKEILECGRPMCAGSVEIQIEGGLLEPGVDHSRHVDTHHCKGISEVVGGERGIKGRSLRVHLSHIMSAYWYCGW